MSAPHEIISDEEIIRVHGHANFGDMSPREVVNDGVRKYAIGYTGGHTQLCILMEHGLITKPKPGKYSANLTQKGKRYARAVSVTHIDTSQAAVAAALEAAADIAKKSADRAHKASKKADEARHYTTEYIEGCVGDEAVTIASEIRTLITPAQHDALAAANARADQARDAALVEAADIILADNYDDPDSAADAILALRDKPAPAVTVQGELQESREYAQALEVELRDRTAKIERECKLAEAQVSRLLDMTNRMDDRLNALVSATEALGAMPEGYCFCSENRIGDDSKTHEPECEDLRSALRAIAGGGDE